MSIPEVPPWSKFKYYEYTVFYVKVRLSLKNYFCVSNVTKDGPELRKINSKAEKCTFYPHSQ